jgi:hypothetical protein
MTPALPRTSRLWKQGPLGTVLLSTWSRDDLPSLALLPVVASPHQFYCFELPAGPAGPASVSRRQIQVTTAVVGFTQSSSRWDCHFLFLVAVACLCSQVGLFLHRDDSRLQIIQTWGLHAHHRVFKLGEAHLWCDLFDDACNVYLLESATLHSCRLHVVTRTDVCMRDAINEALFSFAAYRYHSVSFEN